MRAKRLAMPLVMLLSACTFATAGEVYGKIVEGASSVGEAAALEVKCGAKAYPAVKTDKSGSYRIVLAETGKCTMTVKYKQQSANLDIASYDDAVQIDLVEADDAQHPLRSSSVGEAHGRAEEDLRRRPPTSRRFRVHDFRGIDPDSFPAYRAYVDRVVQSPPVAAALERERIKLDTYKKAA